jgi:hypothetical protein
MQPTLHDESNIQIGSREWTAGVRRIRSLDSDLHWDIADEALRLIPLAKRGGGKKPTVGFLVGVDERQRQLAAETELSPSHIMHLRHTAAAWPESYRHRRGSFWAHSELRNHPRRFDLITDTMTYRGARAIEAERAAGLGRKDGARANTPAELFRELDEASNSLKAGLEIAVQLDLSDETRENALARLGRVKKHTQDIHEVLSGTSLDGWLRDLEGDTSE